MNDFVLSIVICDPSIIVLEAVDEVFAPPVIRAKMEVAGVRITFLEVSDSRILPLSRFLQNSPADDFPLKPFPDILLIVRELSLFLG